MKAGFGVMNSILRLALIASSQLHHAVHCSNAAAVWYNQSECLHSHRCYQLTDSNIRLNFHCATYVLEKWNILEQPPAWKLGRPVLAHIADWVIWLSYNREVTWLGFAQVVTTMWREESRLVAAALSKVLNLVRQLFKSKFSCEEVRNDQALSDYVWPLKSSAY